ncbi:MAG TPA: hypothetical protein VKD72_37240, partial [Gemmataceae bacterium]|nr:hypothetical protein [Gemmataceae bacterium]
MPAHLEVCPVGQREDVIYILCALRRFNTYEFQQRFARSEVPGQKQWNHLDKLDKHAQLALYAREAALMSGPPCDIIAAVKIKRLWTGRFFHAGGKYEILALRINRATCALSLRPYQDVLEGMMLDMEQLARFLG